MAKLRFHNTNHLVRRVDLRNLSTENIKNVVNYPDLKKKVKGRPHHGGQVWAFEKTVDGNKLKVVAEIKGSECWLITAYELS